MQLLLCNDLILFFLRRLRHAANVFFSTFLQTDLSVARKKVEKKLMATKHYETPSFSYLFQMVCSSCHTGYLRDTRMSISANFSRINEVGRAPTKVAFFTKQNAQSINHYEVVHMPVVATQFCQYFLATNCTTQREARTYTYEVQDGQR